MCHYNAQMNLCENSQGYVSWCDRCKHYSIAYGMICMTFTKREFKDFRRVLGQLGPESFETSYGNKETVFLRKNKASLGMCLTREQVQDLRTMFDEASRMYEVYTILNK